MVLAKRALLRGPRDLVFENIEVQSECPGEKDLFVETVCSAISIGTETAAYRGDPALRPGKVYPRFVGYCNVGIVRKIGSGVSNIHVGQRILTHQPHQSAYSCRTEEVLAALDEDVATEDAAVAYLAQLGLAALQKARFHKGETVVIFGLGFIGLATVALVSALGGRAIAIGNDATRLAVAENVGALAALDVSNPGLKRMVSDAAGTTGPQVVVTTVNSWESWKIVLELCQFQSRVAVLGFPGRSEGPPSFNPLDSAFFHDKQLTLCGAGMLEDSQGLTISPRLRENIGTLLQMIQRPSLRFTSLITHRVPWQNLSSVYERAAEHDKALIGAVLDWRS